MGKEGTVQVAFRLPRSLVSLLDGRVEQLTAENLGMEVTRTDVVRMILTQVLGGAVTDAKPGRRR